MTDRAVKLPIEERSIPIGANIFNTVNSNGIKVQECRFNRNQKMEMAENRWNRRVSNTDRGRIIACYKKGDDFILLADSLNINRDIARSIIRVWRAEARIERLPQGGSRNRRMDEEMVETLIAIARDEPFSTLVTLKDKLEARLPSKPRAHISTIARHLENQLISLKIAAKDADVPLRRNIPTTKQRRFEYATWLSGLQINDSVI